MTTYGPWREVSKKRAKKVRKAYRGASEIIPTKPSITSKPRYLWRPIYGIWVLKSWIKDRKD